VKGGSQIRVASRSWGEGEVLLIGARKRKEARLERTKTPPGSALSERARFAPLIRTNAPSLGGLNSTVLRVGRSGEWGVVRGAC